MTDIGEKAELHLIKLFFLLFTFQCLLFELLFKSRLPFYGTDVLVEARFQLDTAVIDLAGVGVGIGVTI